jgi:hypothetical protein
MIQKNNGLKGADVVRITVIGKFAKKNNEMDTNIIVRQMMISYTL